MVSEEGKKQLRWCLGVQVLWHSFFVKWTICWCHAGSSFFSISSKSFVQLKGIDHNIFSVLLRDLIGTTNLSCIESTEAQVREYKITGVSEEIMSFYSSSKTAFSSFERENILPGQWLKSSFGKPCFLLESCVSVCFELSSSKEMFCNWIYRNI